MEMGLIINLLYTKSERVSEGERERTRERERGLFVARKLKNKVSFFLPSFHHPRASGNILFYVEKQSANG